MNPEELLIWQDKVFEHTHIIKKMIEERNALKKEFEEHLSQFFDWGSIEYDKDFNKIELRWENGINPVIQKNIGDLGMEWIIRPGYDERGFEITVIELYPFGLPENEGG